MTYEFIYAAHVTTKKITGIEDFSANMRIGTRRSNADGGPGLHHGKGWDGKGAVTCHSFGCSYNMGKGPVAFL